MVMFATLFVFSANSDAATPKTTSAKVAHSVYVHSKPSANAKKVGTLWKGDKVIIYSKSKTGWAKIKFNKKTAYVFSSYLIFNKNTVQTTPTKKQTNTNQTSSNQTSSKQATKNTTKSSTSEKTSYRPLTTNTYYYVENGQKGKLYSTNKRNSTGWTYWYKKTGANPKQTILVRESTKGLDAQFNKSGSVHLLVYPFVKGQVFNAGNEKNKIVSILSKMTVKAGSFKTVIGVKAANGTISYYAPNAGIIKVVNNNKVIFELTKVATN